MPCFRYYENDSDISNDKELQAFANEISADGTGPDGGNGKVCPFGYLNSFRAVSVCPYPSFCLPPPDPYAIDG